MKFALGTVQLGIDYGIANFKGKVEKNESKSIVNYAKFVGIDTIDTAIAYGDSEKLLGEIGVNSFNLVTKLPEVPQGCKNISMWVNNHISESLKRLRRKNIYGLLLHRPYQLLDLDKKALWGTLLKLKRNGIVEKIGFSIYSPSELDELWNLYKPDLVQAPYNILDRRLDTSGWLERMYLENVEVHIRSIFLQGLLLLDENNRPKKFKKFSETWNSLDLWLKENNLTALQAAVSFSLSDHRIKKIVIGVDSLLQLKEIINASKIINNSFPDHLSIGDAKLLNPSEWGNL